MMPQHEDRIMVNCGPGLYVSHTLAEWAALNAGVDREVVAGMQADLDAYLDRERGSDS